MCKLQYFILLLLILIALKFNCICLVNIDNNHKSSNSSAASMITVERIATFMNGCYKQRTREHDLWNSKKYFETEQLICPPHVNASSMAIIAQQQQKNNSLINTSKFIPANIMPIAILPSPAVSSPFVSSTIKHGKNQTNLMNFPHNSSHVASNFRPAAVLPQQQQHPQQQIVYPIVEQQLLTPVVIPSNTTSHAVILSKKTVFHGHEKKNSSANCLYNNFNWLFVFTFITILFNPNLLRQ